EMTHDFADRAVAQQRHPDDEPHDVLRGQLASAIVAVPVASNACAIHAASSVPLKSSKLGARSPAPTARMASPNSIAPTSVGETNYTLWINGSRIRSLTR